MTFSLYEATIPGMIRLLGCGRGWIDKAKASGMSATEIAGARLASDMAPFAKQVAWMVTHSLGAVEAVRKGSMSPDTSDPEQALDQMQLNLGAAENALRAVAKGEIDSFIGGETRFVIPSRGLDLPFASEDFLLSFSLPNFYFHATTAYGILRHIGVDVGKLDFLGQLPVKQG
jgi:hypothetical protein